MEVEKTRLRNAAMLGKLSSQLVARSEDWKSPSNKLVVFASSTFTDTDRERNVLQEKILPDLREKGRAEGIEVVFVDMRWGVRDENTLDHQTWIACKRELLRCWKEAAGLFFLSLQGDKYGYRPLPRELDVAVLDAAMAHSHDDLLSEWYVFDDNAVGGQYVLKNLASLNDAAFWDTALPTLRDGILSDAQFGEGSDLLVGQSVTEWEARLALSLPGCVERSFWLHRRFDGGVLPAQDPRKLLDDGSNRLEPLKEHMRSVLASEGKVQDAAVRVDCYLAKDAEWANYIADFEARARALFAGAQVEGSGRVIQLVMGVVVRLVPAPCPVLATCWQ